MNTKLLLEIVAQAPTDYQRADELARHLRDIADRLVGGATSGRVHADGKQVGSFDLLDPSTTVTLSTPW